MPLPAASQTLKSVQTLLLTFLASQATLLASDLPQQPLSEADGTLVAQHEPYTEHGLIVADYQVIPLTGGGTIDLLGMRYLQQLNHWLYFGVGFHAPLIEGDYGGFMTLDATLHAQYPLYEGLFIDAGATVGGGGGGSSIEQSKELSGTGGFGIGYIGLGYAFDNGFSAGINYARIKFQDSQIDSSQVNFFIEKSVDYTAGSYADAGKIVPAFYDLLSSHENILTFEMNNIFQIDPQGTNRKTINTLALQYSHFLDDANYLFIEAEVGYRGRPLYNQVLPGAGHRFAFTPHLHLYGQVGVGSGGYSPELIDTGSGLLVYPKAALEYRLNDGVGLAITGGYLAAPTGSSRNYTVGAALDYHLSAGRKKTQGVDTATAPRYKGFRLSIFPQSDLNVKVAHADHHDVHMLSGQLDVLLHQNWYVATQASIAYNDFREYPGYGEILAGFGVQNRYTPSTRFQSFFQLLLGTNVDGVIFKPSVGTSYSLSDRFALYAQVGQIVSVDTADLYHEDRPFSATSVGAGLTYRFSLP
ncbi:hypothetical protein WCX72_09330 [Sulfurimonas sp. HSL1-6]|uniref:hypothetical protein n=1 Tax=Thiomicrolovo immobilis TaxID=3131935 RepID=UPI0031F7D82F